MSDKLLLDTNIIIDFLAARKPYDEEASKIISLGEKGVIQIGTSALSIANTNYILSRQTNAKSSRNILDRFKVLIEIYSLNETIIELALNDERFTDFEDGLQFYSALENQCTAIITRNKKDFKKSTIPVFTGEEFLAKIIPDPKDRGQK